MNAVVRMALNYQRVFRCNVCDEWRPIGELASVGPLTCQKCMKNHLEAEKTMGILTDEQKKEILAEGISQAVKFFDNDAIDAILDAIEFAATNTGGWVKFAVFGVTKVLRLLLGVPDDDVDQSKPI